MRTATLLIVALLLTGCPEKKAEPKPAAASTPAVPEEVASEKVEPAVEIAGCYQWKDEDQEPHQLRLVGKEGAFTGKYLGAEGADFVAWFQVALKDLKVEGDRVSFSIGERDLWGDPMGMDTDLSGKESDGFSRYLWRYTGKIDAKGFTFECKAEEGEVCTLESGLFARVEAKLCGPVPEGF